MSRFFSKILILIILWSVCVPVPAQESYSAIPDDMDNFDVMEGYCEDLYVETIPIKKDLKSQICEKWAKVKEWAWINDVADRLDIGVSLGTMGIGVELQTPVTRWVNLRAGVDFFPRFKVPMDFNLNTFSDGMPTGNFHNVAQMVYDKIGIEMDETVHMYGEGSMVNFKLLADIYPVPENRHWYITAGFYAGTARIGKAYNTLDEKPTLVGLNVYNRAYEYFTTLEDIFNVPLGGNTYMDPDLVERLQEKFRRYGRMGIHIGDFKNGGSYIMEPSPDGTVSADAFVNHFKPYLGAGYTTDLDKAHKWHFAVDLGVLFWGGVPNVINHDYVTGKDINFTKDLYNIRGKVGSYVRAIKAFPVYPVLAVRFSYTIL